MNTASFQSPGQNTFTARKGTHGSVLIGISGFPENGPNLAEINVTATAVIGGQQVNVMSSVNLLPLVLAKSPGSAETLAIGPNRAFRIVFPTPVQLKGPEDYLSVTVSASGTLNLGSTVVFSSESAVNISPYVPIISVYPVLRNTAQQTFSPGNNVSLIAVVNSTNAHGLTSLVVTSDKWECDYRTNDFDALIADQWTRVPNVFSFKAFDASADINNNVPLDSVSISVGVNTDATNDTWIVVYGGQDSATARANARQIRDRVQTQNEIRYFN